MFDKLLAVPAITFTPAVNLIDHVHLAPMQRDVS